jgi:hypothetical protein
VLEIVKSAMRREISAICLAGGGLALNPFSLFSFELVVSLTILVRGGKGEGVEEMSENERRIVRLEAGTGIRLLAKLFMELVQLITVNE